MIHLTQLIYIKPGQEAVFDAFEAAALPLKEASVERIVLIKGMAL